MTQSNLIGISWITRVAVTLTFAAAALPAQATLVAFDSFLAPQPGQTTQLGFGAGSLSVGPPYTMGDSFISSASGMVSDIWLPLAETVTNSPANVSSVRLATDIGGTPDTILGTWLLTDVIELNPTAPIYIDAASQNVSISAGTRYWLLVTAIAPTSGVRWLNGVQWPSPERLSGYGEIGNSGQASSWYSQYGIGAPAYRVDVAAVPEPLTAWLFSAGLVVVALRIRRQPPGAAGNARQRAA